MFSDLMRDKVTVIKQNGEKYEDIHASVQSKKTFIQRSDILIETGDLIQRKMSNGGIETYEVIDPGFHEGDSIIPAFYQIKHKNLALPEAEKAVQSITYNLNGHNSRVNSHSTDNSINVLNINSSVAEHIELLRAEINRLVQSTQEKHDALEIVDAIEGQFSSDKPSKAVVKTLISSLPHAGSIASIGSFLVSALGG